mgnify:FL=1
MKLLNAIIHTIVPHEKHKNIPHLLRKEVVTILSVFVVLLFFVNDNNFKIISGLNLTGAIYPAVLADLTNADRTNDGLHKLDWNPTLEKAAELKANDMVTNSYFAHTSPRGITPWHWLKEANYNFIYAGENLAIDFNESKDVQDALLNSPTHRANLLNQNYTEIGITAVDGSYEGRNTTFVVEFFGKPQATKIAQTPPPTQLATAAKSTEPTLKVITETSKATQKFISVENTNVPEGTVESAVKTPTSTDEGNYSAWYQRIAVSPTNAIKAIYGTILGLVLVAMMLVGFKEYQKHHFKHLVMGVLLIVITGAFLYSIESPEIILAII